MTKENKDEEELSLEEGLGKLEETLGILEDGELSLEESFKLYKKGMELVRFCSEKIDRVEKQLVILDEGEEDEL
ncbi:MAG TPA: exodeoxyribonuclease VII small subunit [Lachnospiraceae bacterium]|nr:exodeoxyribonuclease VII small subunit [Lachnospiraceae bacterium]